MVATEMDREYFYNEFKKYDTEYLITLRARGEELSDIAHAAIEIIAKERGDILPSRPTKYIDIKNNAKKSGCIFSSLSTILTIIMVWILAKVIGREMATSFPLVGSACALGYLGFWIYKKVHKKI